MRGTQAGLLGTVALLAACSSPPAPTESGVACTLIGGGNLVSLVVAADVAPVRGLRLKICGTGCEQWRPYLLPGSTTRDLGCDDEICTAEAVEDGTQGDYLSLPLDERPVVVQGSYRRQGRLVHLRRSTIDTVETFPNGRACGSDGFQVSLVIDATGIHGA